MAVIVGHSISQNMNMSFLFQLIYSFHMPLLIFISAYVEEQGSNKYKSNKLLFLKKRSIGLLLPYFSWNIISCVNIKERYFDYSVFLQKLSGYQQTGLWFLAVLFELKCFHLMYWILTKKCEKRLLSNVLILLALECAVIFIAAMTRMPYMVNMVSYAIPYCFGILYARSHTVKNLTQKEGVTFAAFLLYCLMFPQFDFRNTEYTTQILRILLSVCIILICCKMSAIWKNDHRWEKCLILMGRESMVIYLLHGYFMDYSVFIQKIDSPLVSSIVTIVLGIIVAYICVAMGMILRTSKILSMILFGKALKYQYK